MRTTREISKSKRTSDKRLQTSKLDRKSGARRRQSADGDNVTRGLIMLARSGDQVAFGQLMTRYKAHVLGIAFRMLGDLDDAKDVAQLVFVKTCQSLDSYDPSKRFSTWLHRITVNASIDYIRKRKRHAHEVLDDYAETLENIEDSPASMYERKRLRRLILDAAKTLKRKQRLAFVMRYLDDRDVREISEILDMPETTVRWYIHRARQSLRRELRRRFPLDFKHDGGLIAGHITH